MAEGTDDFDFDLGEASFVLDDDDEFDLDVSVGCKSEECPNQPQNENDAEVRLSPRNGSNDIEDTIEKSSNSPVNQVEDEMEDDEMDAFLSQIDVKEIERSSQVNTTKNHLPTSIRSSPLPTVRTTTSNSQKFMTPRKIHSDNSQSNSKVVEQTNDKTLGSRNTPIKRDYDESETISFFVTQIDPKSEASPAKRSFPGPAGILPNLKSSQDMKNWNQNNQKSSSTNNVVQSLHVPIAKKENFELLRNRNLGIKILPKVKIDPTFPKAPWKRMLQHLKLNLSDKNGLLNIQNIRWLQNFGKRLTFEDRIPFLAVVVKENSELKALQEEMRKDQPSQISVNNKPSRTPNNYNMTIMDPTGIITAILSPGFVETFASLINPGTTLVLRNCPCLMIANRVHLIILKKNVMCLVSSKNNNPEERDEEEENLKKAFSTGTVDHVESEFTTLTLDLKERFKRHDREVNHSINNASNNKIIPPPAPPQLFSHVSTSNGKSSETDAWGDFDEEEDEEFLKAIQNY